MTTTYINGTAHIVNNAEDVLSLIREHMGEGFYRLCRDYIVEAENANKITCYDTAYEILPKKREYNNFCEQWEEWVDTDAITDHEEMLINIINILEGYY